jgi:hypothetical protein
MGHRSGLESGGHIVLVNVRNMTANWTVHSRQEVTRVPMWRGLSWLHHPRIILSNLRSDFASNNDASLTTTTVIKSKQTESDQIPHND